MNTPNKISPYQLGVDLSCIINEQVWYLIQSENTDLTLTDVQDTLHGVERDYRIVPAQTPAALMRSHPSPAACLPTGMESWTDSDFADLDRLRAAIREAWPVLIWVTSTSSSERLVRLAPNFASFFQPAMGVWWYDALSPEETEVYLEELRTRWDQTDDEVITLASNGDLQQDVDHHLWLILLGRGDLIETVGNEPE